MGMVSGQPVGSWVVMEGRPTGAAERVERNPFNIHIDCEVLFPRAGEWVQLLLEQFISLILLEEGDL